jgi:hypothetical protein
MRLTGGLLALAFLALVVLVATSPKRFLYDEPFFVRYIPLLHRYGFSTTFLKSLPGTVGPLYSFVHIALEPFTHLQPVRMRFVNASLLVLTAAILAVWLKGQKRPDYWVAAGSVLVVPMTWVLAGMALSEMPAVALVTLSLYLQLRGLAALEAGGPVLAWHVASAICLAIAVWGRQPYLLLCGVPVLAACFERRLRIPALIFVGIVVGSAVPLFIIWKGLVPPSHHFVQQGISVTHGLLSLGYTGICFFLLAPRRLWLSTRMLLGIVTVTVAGNALLRALAFYPLHSAAERYLPRPALSAYGILCGSLFLSCGVVFLAFLLWITWEHRNDLQQLTVNAGLLCVAASPMFIAHQYSSRYTGMSLPYLILATQPWRRWGVLTVLAAALGCAAGFLSLFGYFRL